MFSMSGLKFTLLLFCFNEVKCQELFNVFKNGVKNATGTREVEIRPNLPLKRVVGLCLGFG